jgi:hypothetical protein
MKPGDSPPRTLVKSVANSRVALPPHAPGLRIGLFGGSFRRMKRIAPSVFLR